MRRLKLWWANKLAISAARIKHPEYQWRIEAGMVKGSFQAPESPKAQATAIFGLTSGISY